MKTNTKTAADFSRNEIRDMEEAQDHLAETVGAAALPNEIRDALEDVVDAPTAKARRESANEMLADLEAAGFLTYDPETCLMTLPMG